MLGTIGSAAGLARLRGRPAADFMRQFNTTAVNLRAALDDVQPLVDATRPGRPQAPPLRQAPARLRPRRRPHRQGPQPDHQLPGSEQRPDRAHPSAGPPGPDRGRAGRPKRRLPARGAAGLRGLLKNSLPQISTLRAYSPELTGWFDDFGHSGFPDAFGGIGRISTTANTFSVGAPSAGVPCNDVVEILKLAGGLPSVCQALNPSELTGALGIKDLQRCPGSNERGLTSDQLTQGGTVDCDPTETPLGP